MNRLYDKLISYREEDYYPFHMPGHKRNTKLCQMSNPYSIDITEIEGFDNLHQAEGILIQLSQRLSLLYGSEKSYPLINGSTVGILAGISSGADRGSKVLIARNCHKSVYHAVVLKELRPVYIYPNYLKEESIYGGISVQDVEDALIRDPDISLVVLTSPTFDGFVSDIRAIAKVVHRHGALFLVDEAHGAHFGFHRGFPESAVTKGADIVIQSMHKTLPAFTQSAVLHSNRTDLNDKIERNLSIYESSSPSYLLLAGMDRCISMLEDSGKELFDLYYARLNEFYSSMNKLEHLRLIKSETKGSFGIYDMDPSKIIISVRDTQLSGHVLHTLLREKYHLIMEMEAPDYVLGMTSICDTQEGFLRLSKALLEIDNVQKAAGNKGCRPSVGTIRPEQVMLPGEAAETDTEQVPLERSAGRISAVFVSMYPPGSPLLVPGERIDDEMIQMIQWLQREGYTITGLNKETKDRIDVIAKTLH